MNPKDISGVTEYDVKVLHGRDSCYFKITSYDSLVCQIQRQWQKIKWTNFKLMHKGSWGSEIAYFPIHKENISFLENPECREIVVRSTAKIFSKFTEWDVFATLHPVFAHFDGIKYTRENVEFPIVASLVLPEATINDLATAAMQQLSLRIKCADLEKASERTMREFIAPILFGAVSGMIDHLKGAGCLKDLRIIYEKPIVGQAYNGPADCIILYDSLGIVVTEAKNFNIRKGILQNLLQQRSSHDMVANAAVGVQEVGKKRTRAVEDALKYISAVPTFGIVSNGSTWVFTATCSSPLSLISI